MITGLEGQALAFFVGIDSGGTKTECWVGNETDVLGRAQAGSVKLTRVGEAVAAERLTQVMREAASKAGIRLHQVTRTCVGMSGYTITQLREWMRAEISGQVGGTVEVCGDEEIALDAAFQGGPGILVISGTGSIVVGRCSDGARFTAGGWGPAIGDEGSGSWIGAEGLRAGFTALDRGVETGLIAAVQAAWGATDSAEVVGLAHMQPGPDFAALTPHVVRLAEAGDEVAAEVLRRGGQALGNQVGMVWRRMAAHGETTSSVACTGSILDNVVAVRRAMEAVLDRHLGLIETVVFPPAGALWRAKTAGGDCTSSGNGF